MLTLVTSNPNKAKEFSRILSGVEVETIALELSERQSMSLEEVVRTKVESAYAEIGRPVLVEDISFEIACLNGFPGPFIKFYAAQVGFERTLEIAETFGDFSVRAICGVGYADGARVIYEEGEMRGTLTARREGEGWGFDFYFIPEGYTETLSELGPEKKDELSHRGNALRAMRDRLKSEGII